MSWNEPGGNKKDPWSGRDNQEYPPNLDEAIKMLQEKLMGLFGKDPKDSSKMLGIALIAILAFWGGSGFYVVDEGNRGVVTRFGRYRETVMSGLHWHLPWPFESAVIVNVEQQRFIEVGYRSVGRQQSSGSVPNEALMLTEDENIVDVRIAVQYQIKDAKDYLFSVLDPERTLKQITESAERAVIGKSTMDFVLTKGRGGIAEDIKQEMQSVLDQYHSGIRIIAVNLIDAQAPEEVQSAFADAIKAREDEQRLKNEAEAYANEVIPTARGAAARLLEEAEAYRQKTIAKSQGEAGRFNELLVEYEKSPDIMRRRLYIDTLESIFEKTNTVLIDVKNGNNVIYLPIDKQSYSTIRPMVAKEPEYTREQGDASESVIRNSRPSNRGRESRLP